MKRKRGKFKGYEIVNTINDKVYIGITSSSLNHRWKLHILSMQYKPHQSALHRAMKKYGVENFLMRQIKNCGTWEELCLWEKRTIIEKNTKVPNGYNITDGGEGAFGVKRSDEFKKKLSENKKLFYKDEEKRKEQSINSIRTHNTKEALVKSKIRSKSLWKDCDYRNKTVAAIIKATRENPKWMECAKSRNRKLAQNPKWVENTKIRNKEFPKDPNWRKKVSDGLLLLYENKPELKKIRSQKLLKYWKEPNTERRKNHAKTMSETTLNNLKNPEYIKWRLENPPGGKPIMYNFKYFRSTREAMRFFKISSPTIERHILQKREGCIRLNKNKEYKFEINY